jgi:hypothetical protein
MHITTILEAHKDILALASNKCKAGGLTMKVLPWN